MIYIYNSYVIIPGIRAHNRDPWFQIDVYGFVSPAPS